MSLRRIDARFVLPHLPATATVADSAEEWGKWLRSLGVQVDGIAGVADLAVAGADQAAEAAASGAAMAIVEGLRGSRALEAAFPVVERFLPIPSIHDPQLILPLHHRTAGDYAIRHWSLGVTIRRRVRNQLARLLLARGALPKLRPLVTVGTRAAGAPFFVRAAASLGVPDRCEWFLTFGSADALTRGVFQLFPPGAVDPSWVLKFARLPGYTAPFDRDERGLRIAHEAGEAARRHAPKLLGRLEVGGLPAAVETAAAGARLTHLLQGRGPRSEKIKAIDAVAAWTIEVAHATAGSPDRLASERRRLTEEVVPAGRELGAPADLVERIGLVPAVVQHNDLGTWNIVSAGGAEFTAVDWESAKTDGLPLWDLVYFLTDALIHLDGASPPERRNDHNLRLFRGELPSSAILFRWLRAYVDALAIPDESVGPLVTLGWLHHRLSVGERHIAREKHAPDQDVEAIDAERVARLWLGTDDLGPGWDRWRSG